MIYGSLFAFSEYKDQREYGILTNPAADGSFWARASPVSVVVSDSNA